jgi:hypothetical protein
MSKIDLKLKQKVPTHFAFIIVIVLSFLLSWFTVSEGRRIAEDAKDSSAFNISKRIELNNAKPLKN